MRQFKNPLHNGKTTEWAASLSTATASVCPQRCGSSGVSASPL